MVIFAFLVPEYGSSRLKSIRIGSKTQCESLKKSSFLCRRGVPEGGPAGRPAAISYLGLPARPSAQKNARCPAPSQVSLSFVLIRDFWPLVRIGDGEKSGSWINISDHISESLVTIFGSQIPKFFVSSVWKARSGIRDEHPGSATLQGTTFVCMLEAKRILKKGKILG